MAKGDRNLGWPGFFRAFTVLCAIMLLLAHRYLDLTAPGSGARQALDIYEGLTLWTVPALFMLWGMFALEEGKPQASAALTGLALPAFGLLIFWGVVYAIVPPLLAGRGGNFTLAGLADLLLSAVKGDTYFHLWVLYPLIGLYLVHPVIHRFTTSASRGELRYFLGLCFLFASLLPLWSAFHPYGAVSIWREQLQVQMVLGWVGCYVGGWYLRHYTISRLAEYLLYILGILGLAVTVMSPAGLDPALLRQYTAPNVTFAAAAFCALFRYVLGVSEERSRRRAVSQLGGCAFGVYLIHQLWVLVLQRLGVSLPALSPVLSVPLFALVLFLLSLPFAWLISLIPGVGAKLT